MKEWLIQKSIINCLSCANSYVVRVNSWSVIKSYTDNFGAVKKRRIKLADEWTPDVIACIPTRITEEMVGKEIGVFVWIEIKKDEKTKQKWLEYPEKYNARKIKFNKTINAQHFAKDKILRSKGVYWLVSSIDDIINKFKTIIGK